MAFSMDWGFKRFFCLFALHVFLFIQSLPSTTAMAKIIQNAPLIISEHMIQPKVTMSLADKKWVAEFEKPKGDPTAFIKPTTTCLSPYLKFGCVSARLFYYKLLEVYKQSKNHTMPPVSLERQLLWWEFFYTQGYGVCNYDRMVDNPICRQVRNSRCMKWILY